MTDGSCTLCGETYTKRGMTRHLRSCKQDHLAGGDPSTYHLAIADAYRTDYWLHVEIEQGVTLAELDDFLRGVWVECCGHMSAFTIGGVEYTKPFRPGGMMTGMGEGVVVGMDRRDMDVALGTLDKGMEFTYEYDFGSTTELSIRVADIGEGVTETSGAAMGDEWNGAIRVLARNEPPEIECQSCGDDATAVCTDHLYRQSGAAWLCDDCQSGHECDDHLFLPVVNSPRVGMCGYTG